jgi:5-oxoprolinase (ATP-hydrolysing) subunit A
MRNRIDINCDMGESFGHWAMGNDEALLGSITSTSIACGVHAGDPGTMRRTVQLALARGVEVGAHPGLPDLVGFGRREMAIKPEEAYNLTAYQIGALMAFVRAEGGTMQHVKPHGALYTMAAQRPELAEAIASAVHDVDPSLILVGLAGSQLILAAERAGLRAAGEAFADRRYLADASLMPRSKSHAVITDPAEAVAQVLEIVGNGRVMDVEGDYVGINAETICIHGDTPGAPEFACQVRARLEAEGVVVRPLGDGA